MPMGNWSGELWSRILCLLIRFQEEINIKLYWRALESNSLFRNRMLLKSHWETVSESPSLEFSISQSDFDKKPIGNWSGDLCAEALYFLMRF